MKRFIMTSSAALAALALSFGAVSANAAVPSAAEIAAAKTPAQHEAIAKAYEAEAKSLEKLAARHESLAQTYGAPAGKPWEAAQAKHCAEVARDLKAAAREEKALAVAHRKLVHVTAG